jgi:hypothetical protein
MLMDVFLMYLVTLVILLIVGEIVSIKMNNSCSMMFISQMIAFIVGFIFLPYFFLITNVGILLKYVILFLLLMIIAPIAYAITGKPVAFFASQSIIFVIVVLLFSDFIGLGGV